MFPGSYFAARFFCARYWAKVGANNAFKAAWAINTNRTSGLTIEPQ